MSDNMPPQSNQPTQPIIVPNMPINPPPVNPIPIPVPAPVSKPVELPVEPPKKKNILKIVMFVVLGILGLLLIIFLIRTLVAKLKTNTTTAEITWWGLWEDQKIIQPLIDEYQQQNPKVKIKYILNSPQDYRERLTNAMAKGTGPDLFSFHNTWIPMFTKDLDPMPATVMGVTEFAQTYYPVVSSDLSVGSNIYGIPLGYDALTLYINDDLFNQAGLSAPKTWVDLRDAAKKLTKIENGAVVRSGVALGRTENVDHWQDILGLMLFQNGVDPSKPEGKKAEDALKYFCVFSAVDGVWNETLPSSTTAFANGQVAMYFGPSWRALNLKEINPNLHFTVVALPQLPKEDGSEADMAYASYWVQGVWNKSKNKTAAWNFLKYVSSKESLTKMFQTASVARGFGEAYPRTDMSQLMLDNPTLAPIVKLAPSAHSWYLMSRTYDGTTGINSQINKYYEDAVNGVCKGTLPAKAMEGLLPGITQVLKQYGLSK